MFVGARMPLLLSLAPLLRGRDERSSLLEGWGEGLSPRVRCERLDLYPLTRIASAMQSDLSRKRGEVKRAASGFLIHTTGERPPSTLMAVPVMYEP
ncbi:hypothetical protein SAMN05444171_5675 [Bradyrhizobium lablabi]|uniref:Secreted protein n=2 Tax=Bradyrhizobium TaxID=374 RepID=A0ABY0PBB6_9BRAD|nr:hypothetical protein SAMN05444163_1495 [Bradyrhizobium ottawaense]SED92579.1 hypothetical protein SAMN05444171_5675 [Bradyrhizobium lablabi]SHL88856.1 hypothetical protein SAMN05444321_4470 [Bradyrhizobium lablabi]